MLTKHVCGGVIVAPIPLFQPHTGLLPIEQNYYVNNVYASKMVKTQQDSHTSLREEDETCKTAGTKKEMDDYSRMRGGKREQARLLPCFYSTRS